MKARIELKLTTREVNKLFVRQLQGKRYFIDAIQYRVNRVINTAHQHDDQASLLLVEFKEKITTLTAHFISETTRLNELLRQKQVFQNKPIQFIVQYRPKILLENHLSPLLAHFLECYDQLIATLKLLFLADCFCTEKDFRHALKHYQIMANQLFSFLLFTPTYRQEKTVL
jgi:hypothetical protein